MPWDPRRLSFLALPTIATVFGVIALAQLTSPVDSVDTGQSVALDQAGEAPAALAFEDTEPDRASPQLGSPASVTSEPEVPGAASATSDTVGSTSATPSTTLKPSTTTRPSTTVVVAVRRDPQQTYITPTSTAIAPTTTVRPTTTATSTTASPTTATSTPASSPTTAAPTTTTAPATTTAAPITAAPTTAAPTTAAPTTQPLTTQAPSTTTPPSSQQLLGVMLEGESTSDPNGGWNNYPTSVASQLGNGVTVHVDGTNGYRIDDVNREGSKAYLLTGGSGLNVAVLWIGINDISQGKNPGDVYAQMNTWVNNRRSEGWDRVVLVTVTKFEHAESVKSYSWGSHAIADQKRQELNNLIAANAVGADRIVDLRGAQGIGDAFSVHDTAWRADRVHFTGTGNEVVADHVATVVASLGS